MSAPIDGGAGATSRSANAAAAANEDILGMMERVKPNVANISTFYLSHIIDLGLIVVNDFHISIFSYAVDVDFKYNQI